MDEFQTFSTLIFQEKNLPPASTFTLGTTEVNQDKRKILSLAKKLSLDIQFYDKHNIRISD